MQYGRFKRRTAVEDLNKRWKHLILNTTVRSLIFLLVPYSQIINSLMFSVAHHTDRALRVVEQTAVRSLAQLHGTKTIKKVSIYCRG
jgi:hypothetical protein